MSLSLGSRAGSLASRLAARWRAATLILAVLAGGCSAAKHHRVLALFFDGVPEPASEVASTAPAVATAVGRRLVRPGEHGPYAAKLCGACHNAAATNALIVPAEELCLRCHTFETSQAYVHGPLASGGCLVCHDPHRSANRALLVSASDGFCLHCHDRSALSDLSASDGHRAQDANCTACHEPHMSARKFLLRPGV